MVEARKRDISRESIGHNKQTDPVSYRQGRIAKIDLQISSNISGVSRSEIDGMEKGNQSRSLVLFNVYGRRYIRILEFLLIHCQPTMHTEAIKFSSVVSIFYLQTARISQKHVQFIID